MHVACFRLVTTCVSLWIEPRMVQRWQQRRTAGMTPSYTSCPLHWPGWPVSLWELYLDYWPPWWSNWLMVKWCGYFCCPLWCMLCIHVPSHYIVHHYWGRNNLLVVKHYVTWYIYMLYNIFIAANIQLYVILHNYAVQYTLTCINRYEYCRIKPERERSVVACWDFYRVNYTMFSCLWDKILHSLKW